MDIPKAEPPPPHYYAPLPCHHDQNYIVLPFYHPTNIHLPPWRRRIIITVAVFLLVAAFLYLLCPSDPSIKIVRLQLNKLHIHTLPVISIDVSLHVTVKVRNLNVYSMDFRHIEVDLKYRGKMLGNVRSGEGHVRALASSYVDAEMEFNGVRVLSDVVFLLEDLARGRVPLDTTTAFTGKLGFWFFQFPLKAKMSCEVLVNTNSQTIVRQNCLSEVYIERKREAHVLPP
ncbi:uncharacterized protein LOC110626296 [Manihot esculenta]|uniref:Late embryogenesis abundant protein LEA-2 subgroup domain-containing protein n=1 Tax=Manihot esculenta TaxID=3983 RepID=A0A2C9UYF7_MANES|nr:uncharacterized protein LOC110626296 [Manihot esculenta]OAY36768.1 hypothetical protein MANES_11G046800v8 [Manihot esculenta]